MADRKHATYPSSSAITITLASLASDTNMAAGRESAEIDNTTNRHLDAQISGRVTVGTTPTAGTRIEIWAVPKMSDAAYPDVFDGTDSAETVTSREAALGSGAKLIASLDVAATTSNVSYYFATTVLAHFTHHPAKMVLFVVHNTVAALHSTGGNHEIHYKGSYETIA